ncbi:MAG: hypothetical protein GY904_09060 [Planctomycetaceae bacterium]|nr:hypothetical protein [Planctomycetaceae bacterium]
MPDYWGPCFAGDSALLGTAVWGTCCGQVSSLDSLGTATDSEQSGEVWGQRPTAVWGQGPTVQIVRHDELLVRAAGDRGLPGVCGDSDCCGHRCWGQALLGTDWLGDSVCGDRAIAGDRDLLGTEICWGAIAGDSDRTTAGRCWGQALLGTDWLGDSGCLLRELAGDDLLGTATVSFADYGMAVTSKYDDNLLRAA